ncbi:MAG TPA: YtxH domain-containing protein [Bacillus bacterium]|nr:YtxH domain-containing protein [Bacillus sp. (in: firmicutes)]
MAKGKSLFLGLFIGGLAGAATALLVAPKSGDELKSTISANSKKVKETLNSLKVESTQLKDQVVQASKEGALILKDFSKDVKTSIDSWKKEIEPQKTNILDELKSIEESIQKLENMKKA